MAAPTPVSRRERRAWRWLDDRLGIGGLRYPVPAHANSLAYTLGGITLARFVLLRDGISAGRTGLIGTGAVIGALALGGILALVRIVVAAERRSRRRYP